MVGARLVVPVAVGREGSERFVEAAGSGRQTTTGWTLEEGQPRHRQRRPGRRLVAVAAAVEREGSKRSVVVVLRRRWIGMKLMTVAAAVIVEVGTAARGASSRRPNGLRCRGTRGGTG